MVMGQAGDVWETLRDYGVEIRALKKRMEAVTSGDTIRADTISGVIPAANIPVYWWYNGNLLGAGVKADLIAGAGVWISGTFVAGRAYYYIGAYATGGGGASGTVAWYESGGLLGEALEVDFEPGNCIWISGSLVAGRPTYEIGFYPSCAGGPGGGISGVDFAVNGDPLCFGAGIDLQEEWGVWISGSCAGGEATYKIGAYSQGGGGGASGTVAFYVDDVLFCSALEAELAAGTGIWISGTCESGGSHARFEIGAYPSAAGGDDILALTYAVAF
jgi:hypothetical protein